MMKQWLAAVCVVWIMIANNEVKYDSSTGQFTVRVHVSSEDGSQSAIVDGTGETEKDASKEAYRLAKEAVEYMESGGA